MRSTDSGTQCPKASPLITSLGGAHAVGGRSLRGMGCNPMVTPSQATDHPGHASGCKAACRAAGREAGPKFIKGTLNVLEPSAPRR